jgi:hypothetical protein
VKKGADSWLSISAIKVSSSLFQHKQPERQCQSEKVRKCRKIKLAFAAEF